MKNIRILPIAITATIMAAILFGGWFAYRHYGVEKPLDRVAGAAAGVESANVEMTKDTVKIDVRLNPDANLGEVYRQIKQGAAGQIGNRQLELKASAQANERLEEAWSRSLFDVAEAMENRKYSDIRKAMSKLSDQFPGVTVRTDIDETNVYISLKDGEAAKFVVLPRQPVKLGVWPNA
ncbi:hypothetical protein ACF3MZ_07485 [Paenibacillaceae bacterium WGS1546]|uniref:hypothetical protein n=1 Tax=Cohnella sp. WGS1546 TaxID=3366810 RepID=UPI00372CFC86